VTVLTVLVVMPTLTLKSPQENARMQLVEENPFTVA